MGYFRIDTDTPPHKKKFQNCTTWGFAYFIYVHRISTFYRNFLEFWGVLESFGEWKGSFSEWSGSFGEFWKVLRSFGEW